MFPLLGVTKCLYRYSTNSPVKTGIEKLMRHFDTSVLTNYSPLPALNLVMLSLSPWSLRTVIPLPVSHTYNIICS